MIRVHSCLCVIRSFLTSNLTIIHILLGGTCTAWFGGNGNSDPSLPTQSGEVESDRRITNKRNPFSADLFGSLCYTIQRGKFKNDFNDLTRIDARLDVSSASAFIRGAAHLISDITRGRVVREVDPLASPRLHVVLQQQVLSPCAYSDIKLVELRQFDEKYAMNRTEMKLYRKT